MMDIYFCIYMITCVKICMRVPLSALVSNIYVCICNVYACIYVHIQDIYVFVSCMCILYVCMHVRVCVSCICIMHPSMCHDNIGYFCTAEWSLFLSCRVASLSLILWVNRDWEKGLFAAHATHPPARQREHTLVVVSCWTANGSLAGFVRVCWVGVVLRPWRVPQAKSKAGVTHK